MNASDMSSGIGDNSSLLDTSCDSASHSQNTCSLRENPHFAESSLINECNDEPSRSNISLEVSNSIEQSQVQNGHVPYNTPLDGFHYNSTPEAHSQKCDVLDQVSKSLANLLSQEHSMDVTISHPVCEINDSEGEMKGSEGEKNEVIMLTITSESPTSVLEADELISDKDEEPKSPTRVNNENTEFQSSQKNNTHQIEFACKLELMPSTCKNMSNSVQNGGICSFEMDKKSLSSSHDSGSFTTSQNTSNDVYSTEENLSDDLNEDDETISASDCPEEKVIDEDSDNSSSYDNVLHCSNPVTYCDDPYNRLSHLSAPIISDLTFSSENSFDRNINDMLEDRNDEELQTSCDNEVIADVKITMENLMDKCAAVFVEDYRNAHCGSDQYPDWEKAGGMNRLDMNAQCEYGVTECTLPTESLRAGLVCTGPTTINDANTGDSMEIGEFADCLAPVDLVCHVNHGQEIGNSNENVIALTLHSSESRNHELDKHTESLESVNMENSQVKCNVHNMENVSERLSEHPHSSDEDIVEISTGEPCTNTPLSESELSQAVKMHHNFIDIQQCASSDLLQFSGKALNLHNGCNSSCPTETFSSTNVDPCAAVSAKVEQGERVSSPSLMVIKDAACVLLGQSDCKEEDKTSVSSTREGKTDQQYGDKSENTCTNMTDSANYNEEEQLLSLACCSSDTNRTEEKHNLPDIIVRKENLDEEEPETLNNKGLETFNSSLISAQQDTKIRQDLHGEEISFSPLCSVTSSMETETLIDGNENTDIIKSESNSVQSSMESKSMTSYSSADRICDKNTEMATETNSLHEHDTKSVIGINTIPSCTETLLVSSNIERDTSVSNVRSTNKQQLQKTVRDPPSKVRENTNYRIEEDHQLFCTQHFSASLSEVSIIDYFKDGRNTSEAHPTINLELSEDSHGCEADHVVPSTDNEVLNHLSPSIFDSEVTVYGTELLKDSNKKSTEDRKHIQISSPCFKWKYAPSMNIDDDPPYDCKQYDEVVAVIPLKTCTRPIRVGLSKRYRSKPLHEKHSKM